MDISILRSTRQERIKLIKKHLPIHEPSRSSGKYDVAYTKQLEQYWYDQRLTENIEMLEDIYFALSHTLLCRQLSDGSLHQHSISSQENIISRILNESYKDIPFIRQLLIGRKTSDFYLPVFHICLEPGSYVWDSRYGSKHLARDLELSRMNGLGAIRHINYSQTAQEIHRNMHVLTNIQRKLTLHEQQRNFRAMACGTLAHYVEHSKLEDLFSQHAAA